MPSFLTHYFVAKETLKRFSDNLQNAVRPHLPLYFFGAQGADFCFFYPSVLGISQNLGSYLHRKGGYDAFAVCKAFSEQPSIFAYALGSITHYATDTVFHPFVYEKAGKSPLRHTRIESAFDSFFLNSFSKNEKPPKISLPKLSPCERQDLFLLYASIVARAGFPPLRKRTFFRAVSLFNAYLPPSSHSLRLKNAVWISAVTPKANLLFERAVRRSLAVCQEFAFAVKKNTPLSYEVFGKNYLTDVLIPRE